MVLLYLVWLTVAIAVAIGLRRSLGHARPKTGQLAIPALVGGCIALATDILYVSIIFDQGSPIDVGRVTGVAAVILIAALLAIGGAIAAHATVARGCLIAGTVLLLVVGVLGLFSIGLPLFAAGLLTLVDAAGPTRRRLSDHQPAQ